MLNSKYFAGILTSGMMMALVSCEKVVLDDENMDFPYKFIAWHSIKWKNIYKQFCYIP